MKKILIFLLVAIVAFGVLTVDAAVTVPERVRIGIKYASTAVKSAAVTSEGGVSVAAKGSSDYIIASFPDSSVIVDMTDSAFVVVNGFGNDFSGALSYCDANGYSLFYRSGAYFAVMENLFTEDAVSAALSSATAVNASAYRMNANSSKTRLKNSAGKTLLIFAQDDGEIMALASKNGGTIGYDGINYREFMEFKRGQSAIDVIANVSMQSYLYGVVPSEIGPSAPLEAQKAQAVCARTYAVKNLNKHSKYGFNLCASTCCQVYFGTKKESAQANKAVDETKGKIITYKDQVITAVYSAHTGGVTANVENVWGSPYDYLKSVPDPHCNDYTWEYELDFAKITDSMKNKGYNLGQVTEVTVDEVASDNRVTKMTIKGTAGSKTFQRESARTVFGMKSQVFYVAGGNLTQSIRTASGVDTTDLLKKYALTADGIKALSGSVSVKDGNNKVTVLSGGGGNKIIGKGYGHGVGLSQCGAIAYAKEGWDYIKILKYYYTGVEVQ